MGSRTSCRAVAGQPENSMTITAQIDPARAEERIARLPAALRSGVRETMQAELLELLATVQAKLSGGVLNARSGNLRDSIRAELSEDDSSIGARVFSDGSVPYARSRNMAAEFDVPALTAANAKALAFSYGGRMAFAKRTAAHTVTIPERFYLRSSLDEFAEGFVSSIRKIATEAAR